MTPEENQHRKETVNALLRATQHLVNLSQIDDRTNGLESRSYSVDEMVNVVSKLLEDSLRRPDNPRP